MSNAGIATPKARAIGVAWTAEGKPRIKDGWVERLSPAEREGVDRALRMRGYRLNGFSIEE